MFSGLLCPRYAESYRGTIYVCQPDPAFRPDRPAALLPLRVVVFRTWSSRCSSAVRARSARWKSRWKRARASCWWRKVRRQAMIPLPKTSRNRLRRRHPADAEAARRHREGAGRAHAARPHQHHRRRGFALHLPGHPDRAGCHPGFRDRGAAPRDRCAVRAVRQTQQEDSARDPDLARRHRRRRPRWPTRSPRTCRSSSSRSRRCSRSSAPPSASKAC